MNSIRPYLIPFFAFFGTFLGFAVLLALQIETEYLYPSLHAVLLVATAVFAGHISLTAFRAYDRGRNTHLLAVSLAFLTFGAGFFFHALTTPGILSVSEDVFDVMEHYGFFIGSVILWWLGSSLFTFHKKTYVRRHALLVGTAIANILFFLIVLLLPQVSVFLERFVDFAIALTDVFLLFALLPIIKQYTHTKNSFLLYLASGIAILVNGAIIPFFYTEWNIVWWYFHVVLLAGFSTVFFGLLFLRGRDIHLEAAFEEVQYRARFSTKITLLLFVLAVVPLIGIQSYILTRLEGSVNDQSIGALTLFAEAKESEVYAYLKNIRSRTANFASDGFIRDTVAGAGEENMDMTERVAFEQYLTREKLSLDRHIAGLNIIDNRGVIIASSAASEVGEDEGADEYVLKAQTLPYGETFIGSIKVRNHFNTTEKTIVVSAPLFARGSSERIGVLAIYFNVSLLSDTLSGAEAIAQGALTSISSRRDTLETYLVIPDRTVVAGTPLLGKSPGEKQLVESFPVLSCLNEGKESEGFWENYRGQEVAGTSMCFPDLGWTLIVEIEKDEILAPVNALNRTLFLIIIGVIFSIFIAGFYLSRRISRPLEDLTSLANRINKGDLDVRADDRTKDEIGVLARAFNMMIDSLTSANKRLTRDSAEIMTKAKEMTAQATNLENTKRAVLNLLDDEKELEENLKKESARLEAIVSSINEGVMVIGTDMTIHLMNPVARSLLELTNVDTKGHTLQEFVKSMREGKSLFADEHPIAKTIREGTPQVGTLEDNYAFQIKSGKMIPIAFATAPLYRDKEVSGVVVAFRNITAEKQFDETRNSFISVASHQLRTPLTSMRWYVEMIQDGDAGAITPQQKDFLGEAYQGILRLTDTLDMLLALSRIETGRTKLEAKDIDLHAYMKGIVAEQKLLFETKKLKVECGCVEGYEPHTFLDPILLRQVALNLISNAVRYSQDGGRILIKLAPENGGVMCSVKDEGIGVPDEYKDKIFEKFFRAQNAISKVPEGNGLGLNLAKSLVEMWGGRLWFESPAEWPASPNDISQGGQEGKTTIRKGTEFFFTMPHIDVAKEGEYTKETKKKGAGGTNGTKK